MSHFSHINSRQSILVLVLRVQVVVLEYYHDCLTFLNFHILNETIAVTVSEQISVITL